MNNYRALFLVTGALLIAFFSRSDSLADDSPEGFTALFNGKDLSGWKGDSRFWSVEDGEIVGSTDDAKAEYNTFLVTEKEYGDFELRVSVKLRNHNSGVQFRSEPIEGKPYAVAGYQADVAEATYFGMLYEEQKRGFMPYWGELSAEERSAVFEAADVDGWNEYVITCKGDNVKIVLNGKTTCDIEDPEGAKNGVIALQLHVGPAMEVRFKDIFIKEL